MNSRKVKGISIFPFIWRIKVVLWCHQNISNDCFSLFREVFVLPVHLTEKIKKRRFVNCYETLSMRYAMQGIPWRESSFQFCVIQATFAIKTLPVHEANNKNWRTFRGLKNCNNFHSWKRSYLLLIIVYQTGCWCHCSS